MEYSEIRRRARENLAGNWGLSIGVTLVAALLGGLIAGSGFSLDLELDAEELRRLPESVLPFIKAWMGVAGILGFIQFIMGGAVQLGYSGFLLKQHDGRELDFHDLFSQFHRFGQGFAQSFLRTLYTILWSLLLIIPGIIKSIGYSMAPFIMADNPEMSAKEAIAASTELMDGHKGDLFILGLTFIGWELLCILSLGIGFLWLNPYMNASYAAFYREIVRQRRYAIED